MKSCSIKFETGKETYDEEYSTSKGKLTCGPEFEFENGIQARKWNSQAQAKLNTRSGTRNRIPSI